MEENLELLEEEEADEVLEVWEEEYYGSDKEYMYWNEEFGEYDVVEKESDDFVEIDSEDEDYIKALGELNDEDIDEFLNDLLE